MISSPTVSTSDARRSFLFLQGLPSPFFARLGAALRARGHAVRRINFNMGDRLFWPSPGGADYRGGAAGWEGWLAARLAAWKVTDLVLFGDCRPRHRAAIRLAGVRGLRVHVAEEGYLRPNWLTFESGGVNGHSHLPRDPDWFLAEAASTPVWTGGTPIVQRFFVRARDDVAYNLAAFLFGAAYPGYETHRPVHPLREYASWIAKLIAKRRDEAAAAAAFEALKAQGAPFHLLPLQLDSDYQLREHSRFAGVAPVIAEVFDSFARAAPPDHRLLVKAHPLDARIIDWRAVTMRAAAERGIADRIVYVDGGLLERMLERAQGVVTVNSTVGFLALHYGLPVQALGEAIYDLPGLTFQGPLDRFWTEGRAPDPQLFDAFRRVVAARTQINGGFFSRRGVGLAVEAAVERLEAAAAPTAQPVRSGGVRAGRSASPPRLRRAVGPA